MRYVILGKGGHAKMLKGVLIRPFYERKFDKFDEEPEFIFLEKGDRLPKPDIYTDFFVGVGDIKTRIELFNLIKELGEPWFDDNFRGVLHPNSCYECLEADRVYYDDLYSDYVISDGNQFLAFSYIGANSRLGQNILVNTGAQIDHDCKIGDHCVISPGAILCGGVELGVACFIVEGVKLDAGTFVPAGTLVCGPSDYRKPIRMVRRDGADEVTFGSENLSDSLGTARYRIHSDTQPD
jgi:hypothetical protein